MIEQLEERSLLAITVDTALDIVDENDGFTSFREAILAANDSVGADTIDFAPSLVASGAASILLTSGELTVSESLTIVGPQSGMLTIDAKNQSRVLNLTTTTGDFIFSNLALVNGRTSGNNGSTEDTIFSGGAIRSITSGLLSLNGVMIRDSETTGKDANGGGLFALGKVVITESTISGNRCDGANADGGGVHVAGAAGMLTITRSKIEGNTASGAGGGIYLFNSEDFVLTTIENSIIRANQSVSWGGGILCQNLRMIDSTLIANSTTGNDAWGGGAFVTYKGTILGSIIANNSTLGDNAKGGGVYFERESSVTGSTVSGNYTMGTGSDGGGLFGATQILLGTCTISGNRTFGQDANGGGISASVQGWNTTIVHNSVEGLNSDGGGLFGRFDGQQSLVALNMAADKASNFSNAVFINARYCLFGPLPENARTDGNDNVVNQDPLLGSLRFNGGHVLFGGHQLLTHAPLPGSPLIDAGNPYFFAIGPSMWDQRGEPWSRIVGGRVDIGAVEAQANPLPGDYSFNGVVDAADYVVWRNTVGSPNDLQADGSGPSFGVPDGVVDQFDFAFWKTNFGNVREEGTPFHVAQGMGSRGQGVEASGGAASVDTSGGDAMSPSGEGDVYLGVLSARSNAASGIETQRAIRRDVIATEGREDALAAWVAARGNLGQESDGAFDAAGVDLDADEDADVVDDVFELIGGAADW